MIDGGLDPVWLDGLGSALDRLAGEIRSKLGRAPDAGDLLLAPACAPEMLPAQALSQLGVDLDALWGTLERARAQATQAREQTRDARRRLTEEIHELRVTKERAIEAQQFERAADLRDQERRLVEEQNTNPPGQSVRGRGATRDPPAARHPPTR
jgi:hypothetical protein